MRTDYESADDPQKIANWDGRQLYVQELARQMAYVLDCDMNDPKGWLEKLSDFYDVAYPATGFLKCHDELQKIRKYIYKEGDKKHLTLAQDSMRRLFRIIHKRLWMNGIWMPLKVKEDPGKAIAEIKE